MEFIRNIQTGTWPTLHPLDPASLCPPFSLHLERTLAARRPTIAGRPSGHRACWICNKPKCIFLIAIWNICTSVFVEKAMEFAKPTVEQEMQSNRTKDAALRVMLRNLCEILDTDGSGVINLAELQLAETNNPDIFERL